MSDVVVGTTWVSAVAELVGARVDLSKPVRVIENWNVKLAQGGEGVLGMMVNRLDAFEIYLFPQVSEEACSLRDWDPIEVMWDTVRHEFSHAAFHDSQRDLLVKMAEQYAWYDGTITQASWSGAVLRRFTGKFSHHGPEWKKFAKQLGAKPVARARY